MSGAMERAARALCDHEAEGSRIEGLSERIFASRIAGDKFIAERYRNKVRAVLMAVREPTPKMVNATWNHPVDRDGGIESQNTRNERIYKAMIDAILGEGEGE